MQSFPPVDEILLGELDLEIRIKERLANVLNERIKLATALKASLETEKLPSETDFKLLTTDILTRLHAPVQNLYNLFFTEPPIPPVCRLESVASAVGRRGKPVTRNVASKKNRSTGFLYLRGSGDDKDQYLVLRCPNCSKVTFTNLQGLYNHARLSHKMEWGNHEECVKVCSIKAVLQGDVLRVENDSLELDLSSGVDVGHNQLPGVKTLFQLGLEGASQPYRPLKRKREEPVDLNATLGLHGETPALAQFLGKEARRREIRVHDEAVDIMTLSENPSGRWKKKYAQRSRAHDDEQEVVELPTPVNQSTPVQPIIRSTRFHFSARVVITDRSLYVPPDKRKIPNKFFTHKWMISVEAPAYSHDITTILTRIDVYAPDGSRLSKSEPPFLVVGTALESFMARIELLFAPAEGFDQPQRIIATHFVDFDPAKIYNVAVGSRQTLDVDLDKNTVLLPKKTGYGQVASRHWWDIEKIKLEPKEEDPSLPTATECAGYERVLRSLLPKFPLALKDIPGPNPTKTANSLRLDYRLVPTREAFGNLVLGRKKAIEWGLATALQSAYTSYFMNSTDSADEELISLTVGDVYAWCVDIGYFVREKPPLVENVPTTQRSSSVASTRAGSVVTDGSRHDKKEEAFCSICGMTILAHPDLDQKELVKQKSRSAVESSQTGTSQASEGGISSPFPCSLASTSFRVAKTPLLHVGVLFLGYPGLGANAWQWIQQQHAAQQHILAQSLAQNHAARESAEKPATTIADPVASSSNDDALVGGHRYKFADITQGADPVLTEAVMNIVTRLKLSCAPPTDSTEDSVFPVSKYGSEPSAIHQYLAPYSVLSLAVKQFVKVLVDGAVEVSRQEVRQALTSAALAPSTASSPTTATTSQPTTARQRRQVRPKMQQRMIVPMHVLSAITHGISPVSVDSNRWKFSGMSGPRSSSSSTTSLTTGVSWTELNLAMFTSLARLGIGLTTEAAALQTASSSTAVTLASRAASETPQASKDTSKVQPVTTQPKAKSTTVTATSKAAEQETTAEDTKKTSTAVT